MSKANFHQMRAQGHDVDDSGNMFNEQEHIQHPNPLTDQQKEIVFGCKVNQLTKEALRKKYGIEIK